MMKATILCSLVLSSFFHKSNLEHEERVCLEVYEKAAEQGLDPALALAVSFRESAFRSDSASSKKAIGPMQIIPKWCCPGRTAKGCDLVYHGVRILVKLHKKHGSWPEALCHYNAGIHCGEKSRKYAADVLKIQNKIKGL